MKRSMRLIVGIISLTSLFLGSASGLTYSIREVSAAAQGVAEGDWQLLAPGISGVDVPMETLTTPNSSWLQLLTDGISISGPSEICHPFRGGQFGWIGTIYELKEDKWIKMETTSKWYPDPEGMFIACANAPEAGTYALFGYFTSIEKPCKRYELSSLDAYVVGDNGYIYYGSISPADANIKVVYRITNVTPKGAITGALSGVTYTDGDGNFTFSAPFFIDYELLTGLRQKFYVNNCPLSASPS